MKNSRFVKDVNQYLSKCMSLLCVCIRWVMQKYLKDPVTLLTLLFFSGGLVMLNFHISV